MCITLGVNAQALCRAITKSGKQCTRKAIDDGYCKQHYLMAHRDDKAIDIWLKRHPKKPVIDLPEEWMAISTSPSQPERMLVWFDSLGNVIHIQFDNRH